MTSVASDLDQSSPRIDHFSHLPNELLDDIFELAHYHSRRPLSKRLLPFFESHFYRKVSLSSLRQCSRFLESITAQPHRSKLVQTLSLPYFTELRPDYLRILENLFPLLSNLSHLDFHHIHVLFGPKLTKVKLPPSLRSLTTSLHDDDTYYDSDEFEPDLDQLVKLADLPNLNELRIVGWGPMYDFRYSLPTWSTTVETLRIEFGHDNEYDDDTEFLREICPALKHLEIVSDSSNSMDFDVRGYSTSLESLSLTAEERLSADRDPQFGRFTQLRSLTLGNGCYSHLLPSSLHSLPSLVDITLGQGIVDPVAWQPLVSGPTRLKHLKVLKLDIAFAERGYKIPKPSTAGFEAKRALKLYPVDMSDWGLPNEYDPFSDDFDGQGTRKLIKLAKENGIQVEGTVLEALEIITDYWIEKYNRVIIEFQVTTDSSEIVFAQDQAWNEGGVVLPACTFKPRDRNFVEIDLPKRNRFVLCIRDSGGDRQREGLEDWEDY